MRLLFALPGFHREDRGAEIALLAVAEELARTGDCVTVVGSGASRPGTAYSYVRASAVGRRRFEKFPRIPPFRSETVWEDASFALSLVRRYRPAEFDAVLTCNFPFTQWALRRWTLGHRPKQIFVTQNGDWPAWSNSAEFRMFRCDGLICTNPDYADRNRDRWPTALIPNGCDPQRYRAASGNRQAFGIPEDVPVVLMVSALIPTKRVLDGIDSVARMDRAHLVVAGDGPLREAVDARAAERLPGRFTRLTVPAEEMPRLYCSADAFLHMSLEESFGNVFLEALASGLPVVGHDTPRLRWIVGDTEFLCDIGSTDAVVDAIGQALTRTSGDGDARLAQFTWPVIARQYRNFISEVVAA